MRVGVIIDWLDGIVLNHYIAILMGLGFQWHHSHSEDNVAQTQLTAAAADFVAAPVGQGLPGNYSLA